MFKIIILKVLLITLFVQLFKADVLFNGGFDIKEKLIFCCNDTETGANPIDNHKINPPREPVNANLVRRINIGQMSKQKCEQYSKCKLDNEENYFEITVVGGKPVHNGELPYMAALGWPSADGKDFSFKCGGSLISEIFVLTAAHCTQIIGDETVNSETPTIVRMGEVNIYDLTSENLLDVEISEIMVHPEYKPPKKYHDIALLKLKEFVRITSTIRPACLWKSAPSEDDYTKLIATGWGRTSYGGEGSDVLLKVELYVANASRCDSEYSINRKLPRGIISGQLCAGDYVVEDTCQGDSGGPLVVKDEDNKCAFHQVGITSFGKGCGFSVPGVYTRVEEYLEWIEKIVWQEELQL